MTHPADFFSPGGALARVLPGYEERKAQIRLSEAVGDVLEHGGLLLAEAGTGTGKTLAYLLPAVLSERRVVISTGTKNLQEQLVQKDLPLLAQALGRELRVAVMKGRGNYLCLLRFSSFGKAGELPAARGAAGVQGGRGVVDHHRDRRPGRGPRHAGQRRLLARGLGRERELHRLVVLALRRLLRHAHAPERHSRPTWWW